jgi:hypothetical protein
MGAIWSDLRGRLLALVHDSVMGVRYQLCRSEHDREDHQPGEEDWPPPPRAAQERCAPRPDLEFLEHKYALVLCEPLVEEGYFVWPLTKSPMTFGFREREGQSYPTFDL